MLAVIWRESAVEDLGEILDYLGRSSPSAALTLLNEIEQRVDKLPRHPHLYRTGRVAGTRELVAHPNYIVIYHLVSGVIEILAVLHAREKFPK